MTDSEFIVITANPRQAASMLAALRLWQRLTTRRQRAGGLPESAIATGGSKFRALTNPEIDELCEQIATGPLDVKPPPSRPASIYVVVIVRGGVVVPEAFGTKELADAFVLGQTDVLSGPWQIYVGD